MTLKLPTCPPVMRDNRCPDAEYKPYSLPCKRVAVLVICKQTGKTCPFAGQ